MKKIIFVLIFLVYFFGKPVLANIGVGVGTGKIVVNDELRPGVIYELPALTVLNTGDEESDFEVGVSYHEKQPELMPPSSWFIFSPQKFHLKPGAVKTVNIKLNLPIQTAPGKYFAYLEGHPLKKTKVGTTSVGVAAAAKLYFTIVPANFVLGIYYKATSLWKVYAPWPQRILILVSLLIVFLLFKKFFHLEINLKKQQKQ